MGLLHRLIIALLLCSFIVPLVSSTASGIPASSFSLKNGEWVDNFGIDRNNADTNGSLMGYLPNLAFETLGDNKELAFSTGEFFQSQYPSKTERAAAILRYVQTWTEYGDDSSTFIRDGVPQEEWAQNADEFIHALNTTTGVKAVGDCEDMAFLCSTIYLGAGFNVSIVDAYDHAALLIWLPEYSNANDYWDINDGRGEGWIWVEATGSTNPLGWTPSDFEDGDWTAYHLTNTSAFEIEPQQYYPTSTSIDLSTLGIIVLVIVGIISVLGRLIRAHTSRQW